MLESLKLLKKSFIFKFKKALAKKKRLKLIIGSNCDISSNANFYGNGQIVLGSNVKISDNVLLKADGNLIKIGNNSIIDDYAIMRLWGGEIEIGNNFYLNSFSVLNGHGGLKIGDNVLIANHVSIVPANHIHNDLSRPINKQGLITNGITIEDDVWIAAGASILDGVTIGKGAVIGAGSVVTKNVEPFSVVAGIPAKLIKKRN